MAQPKTVRYRELLLPRLVVWLLPVGFAGCLAIAYGYAYGAAIGWAVGAVTASLLLGAMAALGRTRLEVDDRDVRAGRACLPLQYVGTVRALNRHETFQARTIAADPRAYLVLRPWASAQAVLFEVEDCLDPHPYWLVSTRHPEVFAAAIVAARDQAPVV